MLLGIFQSRHEFTEKDIVDFQKKLMSIVNVGPRLLDLMVRLIMNTSFEVVTLVTIFSYTETCTNIVSRALKP